MSGKYVASGASAFVFAVQISTSWALVNSAPDCGGSVVSGGVGEGVAERVGVGLGDRGAVVALGVGVYAGVGAHPASRTSTGCSTRAGRRRISGC
jgi:hypothetical protein